MILTEAYGVMGSKKSDEKRKSDENVRKEKGNVRLTDGFAFPFSVTI